MAVSNSVVPGLGLARIQLPISGRVSERWATDGPPRWMISSNCLQVVVDVEARPRSPSKRRRSTWPVGRAASRSALRRIWPARPDLAHGFASRPHSHHQESTGAQLPPQPVKAGDRPPVAPADTAGADRRPWSRPIAGRFQAPQLALFSGICHSANRRPI